MNSRDFKFLSFPFLTQITTSVKISTIKQWTMINRIILLVKREEVISRDDSFLENLWKKRYNVAGTCFRGGRDN